MDKELMLDVGQATEIKLAARRAGANNADIKRLSEGDMFARILPVLRGFGEVTITKIDLDADPFLPTGLLEVVEHIKGGQFTFDPAKVVLYLDEAQKGGGVIGGNQLREKLRGRPVYNANLLDFYLKNSHLIPEDWKDEMGGFFWGTIYRRGSGGRLYVRSLCFHDGGWFWYCIWFHYLCRWYCCCSDRLCRYSFWDYY